MRLCCFVFFWFTNPSSDLNLKENLWPLPGIKQLELHLFPMVGKQFSKHVSVWISAQLASRTNLPRHCKSFSDGEGFTLTLWVAAQITPSKTMSKLPRWVSVSYSLSIQTKTIEEKAAVHRKTQSKNQIKTQWKMSWQQTGSIMWHVSRAKKKHTATNTADISWVGGPSVWSRTGCPSFCYENVTSTSSGRLQMLVWGLRSVL